MANEFLAGSDVDRISENIFNAIAKKAEDLQEAVQDVIDTVTNMPNADIDYYAGELAYTNVLDLIYEQMYNIIEEGTLKACIDSVEYNYQPYIEHLLGAIRANLSDLIGVYPNYGNRSVLVRTSFELLGDIHEWTAISDAAIERKIPDRAVRAQIWKEKIYSTARLGGKVYRKRKNKKGKTTRRDVTEKYTHKYAETIEKRLSLTSHNKAPFWYFIQWGNVGESTEAEYVFPVVHPTYFVSSIANRIAQIYEDNYENYFQKARQYLLDNIVDYNEGDGGGPVEEIPEPPTEEGDDDAIVDIIEDIDHVYKRYCRGGRQYISVFRKTGGFMSFAEAGVKQVRFTVREREQVRLQDIITGRFLATFEAGR